MLRFHLIFLILQLALKKDIRILKHLVTFRKDQMVIYTTMQSIIQERTD